MKRTFLLAATSFCFTAWSQPNLQNRFDSLTAAYENNGYHGVILVAKGNTILYEKGYGYANFDQQIKHTPATVFKTESVGKMFTATAILQLVEQKKLKLTQTVAELLPELKIANAGKITVDHLLKHTSGLQSPWDHPSFTFKKAYSKAELMKIVEEVPPVFDTPGKEMFYSNSGYCVLGWILEKISKKPFDQYFQEAFFSRLGMSQTRHLGDTLMPLANGAQPYRIISSKKHISMGETVGARASAAGGWISTAKDLYRFMQALNSGKLLKAETWETMKTANQTNPADSMYRFYAYGLETYINQLIPGSKLYGHNGGGAGFSVDAFVDAETGFVVTSCTNLYQNSRPIVVNYLKAAMNKPLQPVSRSFAVTLYDLIDSVGMDRFFQNEKDYFKQLGLNMHPGMFVELSEAMVQAGDHPLCTRWMELARTYFPEEGYLWMLSGDHLQTAGNKDGARKMFEKAKEVAARRNDTRVSGMVEAKLKNML